MTAGSLTSAKAAEGKKSAAVLKSKETGLMAVSRLCGSGGEGGLAPVPMNGVVGYIHWTRGPVLS